MSDKTIAVFADTAEAYEELCSGARALGGRPVALWALRSASLPSSNTSMTNGSCPSTSTLPCRTRLSSCTARERPFLNRMGSGASSLSGRSSTSCTEKSFPR